jgi:hypothetical protein
MEDRRVIAQLARLPDRLVDCRIKRNDAAGEFASLNSRVRYLMSRHY